MTFYTENENLSSVIATLSQYKDIELSHNTISVTRHKQQIESQVSILRQQLASVERLINKTEVEFDEIASFAKTSNNPETYANAIKQKLLLLDSLTKRKISLNSQLDNYYQQANDLSERLGVVEFSLNITRLNPIYPNGTSRQWQRAWDDLSDTFTETLIGLTTLFGIFILRAIHILVYLLVSIVILRGLWKFVIVLWKKW